MIKHYCDRCGKEINKDERCVCSISIRGALSSPSEQVEFCHDCIAEAFGKPFVDRIMENMQKRKEQIAARRAAAEERAAAIKAMEANEGANEKI